MSETICHLLNRFCNGDESQTQQIYTEILNHQTGYVAMLLVEADKYSFNEPSPGKCYAIKIFGARNYAEYTDRINNSIIKHKYSYLCLLCQSIDKPYLWAKYLKDEIERNICKYKNRGFDAAFIELGVGDCVNCTSGQLLQIMEFATKFLYPENKAKYDPMSRFRHLKKNNA